MDHLQRIQNFTQLKVLADARRLSILQLLMERPATLTQLGEELNEHPAQVRYHLKKLEAVDLIELVETRIVGGYVEKYYQAKAHAFMLQDMILPISRKPNRIVILGSDDLALGLLAGNVPETEILTFPVGSLEGLVALREGQAQLAGCHLLDVESGEYNLPYVRHFFPDRDIKLVTLAHREQGLLVTKDNPYQIHKLEDIGQPGVRFANRNKGSGTRLWFDRQLQKLSIPPHRINGYSLQLHTHTQVAEHIARGEADAGIGLCAVAATFGLKFIPLFQERFDLVTPQEQYTNPSLIPFFETLNSGIFRSTINHLGGYNTTHSGETINP